VVDGVVYVGSGDVDGQRESNLYAIDGASGKQRWAFLTGSIVHGSPVVVDGVVYVGSEDSKHYALESASAGTPAAATPAS
jgi:outer membrane protein assembly factor BamB